MIRARLWLLTVVLSCLQVAGILAADTVALKQGAPAPFTGILQSVKTAKGVRAKLLALTELRGALDARSAEATALRSSVAIHEQREAAYKAEADRAVQTAGVARAHAKVAGTRGLIKGVSLGMALKTALGALFGL